MPQFAAVGYNVEGLYDAPHNPFRLTHDSSLIIVHAPTISDIPAIIMAGRILLV